MAKRNDERVDVLSIKDPNAQIKPKIAKAGNYWALPLLRAIS